MGISQQQLNTVVIALRASSDPVVVNALAHNNHVKLADWCNDNSATKAWMSAASRRDLFEAMNIATYDAVSAGKKDSWQMMMSVAPIDMARAAMRKGILDIFVTADANTMLAALTEWASNAELLLGGNSATSGTVTALKRNWAGEIDAKELKQAFIESQ